MLIPVEGTDMLQEVPDRRTVVDYQVVASIRVQSLTEDVNYWISKGWQPLGSISAHGMHICQVMVRYAE